MLQVREHAPTFFFFLAIYTLGPTFGSFEEFGGVSLKSTKELELMQVKFPIIVSKSSALQIMGRSIYYF